MQEKPDIDLPVFAAPPGGKLDAAMLSAFDEHGFLVLEDFVTTAACDRLRARAAELGETYLVLDAEGRRRFLEILARHYDVDAAEVDAAIEAREAAEEPAARHRAETRLRQARSLRVLAGLLATAAFAIALVTLPQSFVITTS